MFVRETENIRQRKIYSDWFKNILQFFFADKKIEFSSFNGGGEGTRYPKYFSLASGLWPLSSRA